VPLRAICTQPQLVQPQTIRKASFAVLVRWYQLADHDAPLPERANLLVCAASHGDMGGRGRGTKGRPRRMHQIVQVVLQVLIGQFESLADKRSREYSHEQSLLPLDIPHQLDRVETKGQMNINCRAQAGVAPGHKEKAVAVDRTIVREGLPSSLSFRVNYIISEYQLFTHFN
jgi:hypothetical protein